MRRRNGFSLALVLIVMILLIFLSAVIMDMTTNYFHSSESVITRNQLYNAAESGIQGGKAWLLSNSSDLNVLSDDFQLSASSDISELYVKVSGNPYSYGITHESIDSVDVSILHCDYSASDHIEGLPPIYAEFFSEGSTGVINDGEGQSGYISPPRNILGVGNVSGGRVFVITSKAVAGERDLEIEAMVVIPRD